MPKHTWTPAEINRTIEVYLEHRHPSDSVPDAAVTGLSVELGLGVNIVRAAVNAVQALDAASMRTYPRASNELRGQWAARGLPAKPPADAAVREEEVVAAGEPLDEPFVDAVERALGLLADLPTASTTADRARLIEEEELPRHVFSWLARRGAIEPAEGPGRGKRRVLSKKGRGWLADPDLIPQPSGGVPGWKRRMRDSLSGFARAQQLRTSVSRPYVLAARRQWTDNLWGAVRPHVGKGIAIAEGDLHRWIHHLQSSQAFALNLFGPLAVAAATKDPRWQWALDAWAPHFTNVSAVHFEFPSTEDLLSEQQPGRPHRTRIDVVIEHDGDKSSLIEVKFTEHEFGTCSAGHDKKNPRRAVCTAPWTLAGGAGCTLAVDQQRSYFRLLPTSVVNVDALVAHGQTGCPLRGGLYQLVRNLLMASQVRGLQRRRVAFGVFAPGPRLNARLHSPASLENADSLSALLAELTRGQAVETFFLPFEQVLAGMASRCTEGEASAWHSYVTAKYLRTLEAAAGGAGR